MARRRRLPGVSAQLRRRRRRRRRGPRRPGEPAGPPRLAGRRRGLAVTGLPLAAGRQRLRHQRLPGHRPGLRDPGGVRRPAGGPPRPGDAARHGPRGQPHLRRAPVVHRCPLVGRQPVPRLVLVAAAAARLHRRRAGRRAHQLGVGLLRPGLGARRGLRRVLPAPVLPQAAGPELGEPAGARSDPLDDALVAGPGGGRLPDGCHQLHLQGPCGCRMGRWRRARRTATGRRRT